jgi:hypothetical protein
MQALRPLQAGSRWREVQWQVAREWSASEGAWKGSVVPNDGGQRERMPAGSLLYLDATSL